MKHELDKVKEVKQLLAELCQKTSGDYEKQRYNSAYRSIFEAQIKIEERSSNEQGKENQKSPE